MEKLSFKLPVFEGPLDALLFLISKNKLNIYDIPISELFDQYMECLGVLREADMEIASEFLEMASKLVQIKSALLLPRYEEEDPRKELVTALLEYKTCKAMALALSQRNRGFDRFVREQQPVEHDFTYRFRHEAAELAQAYRSVFSRIKRRQPPPVTAFQGVVGRKIVSVTARVVHIVRRLLREGCRSFSSLFDDSTGRSEAVATFLAVLELIKSKRAVLEESEGTEQLRLVKVRNGGEV